MGAQVLVHLKFGVNQQILELRLARCLLLELRWLVIIIETDHLLGIRWLHHHVILSDLHGNCRLVKTGGLPEIGGINIFKRADE